MSKPMSAILTMLMTATLVSGVAYPAHADAQPWWDDFPLIMETDSVSAAQALHATIINNSGTHSPSWGPYVTKVATAANVQSAFENAGFKTITYFTTYGESTIFIAELGTNTGDGAPILHHFWSWGSYSGGTTAWVGAPDFFENKAYAQPYTRTHPLYGGGQMTYPDGTVATGYNGSDTDPRNSRIYDAGSAKNILGGLVYSYDTINSPPYTGLIHEGSQYFGAFYMNKDTACPKWLEMDRATVKFAVATRGLDGMWTDNFSPWSSFGSRPVECAFGNWSVARFRDYLSSHFAPGELATMGVTDVSTFDIRTALRAQVVTLGGNGDSLSDPEWNSTAWLDLPLWRAYVIFKRQTGTEALSNYYHGVKEAAAEAGNNDFFVAGNDIPGFSLGWPRGDLDMACCETALGWTWDSGSHIPGLPPDTRMAPKYKLAREHAKSRFVSPWLYFETYGGYDAYRQKPGVVGTLFYEMLANHTFPYAHLAEPRISNLPQLYSEFNAFVNSVRSTFGGRVPVEEVGVYYSSSSVLMQMTPGGFVNTDNQPHQFAVYGWGTALGDLHYQYRYVPEWKLNAQTLAGLRVLIVPDAEVFDSDDVTGVLQPWVQNGGLLLVTGNSGARRGEPHNFDTSPGGLSLASLTGVSSMSPTPGETFTTVGSGKVLYLPDNIGSEYFTSLSSRPSLLSNFSNAMEQLLASAAPLTLSAPTVGRSVGLNVFKDQSAGKLFIDINNMNCNAVTDVITPTGPLNFSINLPPWLDVPDVQATAFSPDGATSVAIAKAGDSASLSVVSVTRYVSVLLSFPDADGDGLSDATEIMLGTNPNASDTDHDGLSDYAEVYWDGDMTPNIYDPISNPAGTDLDPNNPDTDGDGVTDGAEASFGLDPLDAEDTPELPVLTGAGLAALLAALILVGLRWEITGDRYEWH